MTSCATGLFTTFLSKAACSELFALLSPTFPVTCKLGIRWHAFVAHRRRVRVVCKPTPIRDVYTETFRYDRYLAKERVYLLADNYRRQKVVGFGATFQSHMAQIRDGFEAALSRILPRAASLAPRGASLWRALSMLPSVWWKDFRRTGTMHCGRLRTNVMIVTEALFWTLTVFAPPTPHSSLIVIGLVAYVLFAGAGRRGARHHHGSGLVLLARGNSGDRVRRLRYF